MPRTSRLLGALGCCNSADNYPVRSHTRPSSRETRQRRPVTHSEPCWLCDSIARGSGPPASPRKAPPTSDSGQNSSAASTHPYGEAPKLAQTPSQSTSHQSHDRSTAGCRIKEGSLGGSLSLFEYLFDIFGPYAFLAFETANMPDTWLNAERLGASILTFQGHSR